MLFALWAFDAIIDLGSGTYQVGTLRRVGSGNPIEAILNSQSKRFSPTVIGYDGEQFHVGEYGAAFAKRNPGPVFRYFSADPISNITKYANDPEAPELEDVVQYHSVLLITALMNHVVTHMIRRNDTQIDITLIHPPRLTLSQLSAFKTSIEQLPNTTLFLTVPTPAAVVITHLASRMKDFDKDKRGYQFIVVDIGASTTEASVIQAIFSQENNDVEVHLVYNVYYPKGGEDLNSCIAKRFVIPNLPNYDPKDLKLKKLIRDGVEKAKISLSGLDFTQLTVESVSSSSDDFKMEITRAQLEECAAEIWNDDTLADFMNIAFHVDMDFGDDTFYLFYGGSSRIPYLQQYFEGFFGQPILKTVNLDEGAIYGGGLVTARHIVGFKVANRFNSFDDTRPFLYYNSDRNSTEKLYRLNAHVKHGFTTDFPLYTAETFKLDNGSFNVNHINESYYWETDESGERKKKSSQMYNTDSVEYTKIISDPDPFTQLKFATYVDEESREEAYFNYVCNLTIAKFDYKTILKKYEPKKKDNNGMSGIKVQKMPEIRRDAEKYSQSVKDFYELVVSHLTNETIREQYDIKLAVNFTTDSASMPNVSYVAMHVIDKKKMQAAAENEGKGRRVDPSTYTQEFALESKCEFKHNPGYMVDEYIFREAFNVVWDSNDIQSKRKQYEDSFNLIEDILINADEFLLKYPASEAEEGNYLVYKSEADFLKVAIDDARYFMQHNNYLPHCPCVECLEERLHDLSAVLTRVIELQQNISKHIEISQCRPAVEEKYNKAIADMEDAIAKVIEFQTTDKAAKFNQTMAQCTIIKNLAIDADEDKPKDDDKKKKKEPKKAKLPQNIQEKEWFKGLFTMYAEQSNGTITEDDVADLENYYTKGMMKKLRKSNNDCGFLNGSYSKMVKKLENLTSEKDGKRKDFIEFKEKFSAEMSMRPETECDRIKNRTKDVEKEVDDLTKSIKDTRSEIDRARLLNVIPQLYEQAKEYKRLTTVVAGLNELLTSGKHQEAADILAQETKQNVTEAQVQQFKASPHYQKLQSSDINNYDRVLDDIKDFFRFDSQANKDEL